jgi:DNA-binding CsgD family transcriptional regulator
MNQGKDFEILIQLVRGRISLAKNKRLREALAERGDPARRLDKELPAAVAIEWAELHPDREPPASEEEVSKDEIRSLVNKVTRRLERQGDESEDKIIRAARRAPAETDEDEASDEARQILLRIGEGAQLTPSEMRVFKLTTFGAGEEEIAELLGIELESVARTKRRLAQKLKKSAAKSGFSEQIG